jgi:hypothetical protein
MKAGILRRSSSIKATSAVSMAVSVPAAPMAKPMLDLAKRRRVVDAIADHPYNVAARLQLLQWPAACRLRQQVAACLVDAHLLCDHASAVCGLSPVSMWCFTPSACSSSIAWRLESP